MSLLSFFLVSSISQRHQLYVAHQYSSRHQICLLKHQTSPTIPSQLCSDLKVSTITNSDSHMTRLNLYRSLLMREFNMLSVSWSNLIVTCGAPVFFGTLNQFSPRRVKLIFFLGLLGQFSCHKLIPTLQSRYLGPIFKSQQRKSFSSFLFFFL